MYGYVALVSCLLAWGSPGFAQQSVDYASIGGRVLDPSGAVVPGAQVSARHLDTNITTAAVTDIAGRFRLPALKIGRYDVIVHQNGFADVTRQLTLAAGAAFEIPITLTVASVGAELAVAADAAVLDAARSQIAATVSAGRSRRPAAERPQLPGIALVIPGVSPTNLNSRSSLPRPRPSSAPACRSAAAQPLEQLHRGRPVGQ